MKNNKDGMEYEDVEPNFYYHKEEQGEQLIDLVGDFLTMGIDTLRQGSGVVVQHIRRNDMVYTMLILFVSVWISGWFANAGNAFLSLLSVVLGVVFVTVFNLINVRSR